MEAIDVDGALNREAMWSICALEISEAARWDRTRALYAAKYQLMYKERVFHHRSAKPLAVFGHVSENSRALSRVRFRV